MGDVVVFVLKGYPRLSETFVAQEIRALEARGLDIRIASLRHPTDKAVHPVHREIRAPVSYLPEYLYQEPLRVFRAWWRQRGRPGYRVAQAVWLADLWRDRTANRVRRFGQALVLADELPVGATRLHAHFLHTPASVARYASLLTGLPWSCSAHAKDVWTTPDWEMREKLAAADWVVTCTAAGRAHLAALAPEGEETLSRSCGGGRGSVRQHGEGEGQGMARPPGPRPDPHPAPAAPPSPATRERGKAAPSGPQVDPGKERVMLVYHGLDLARFAAPPPRPAAGGRDGRAAGDPVVLLSVGRAVEKKGYGDLLEALARLPASLSWRLVHIGDGPLLDALRLRAAALGLAGRIDWLGAQPQDVVLRHYGQADLFVLASRIAADGDRDGLPNVLMEAQSQRLAVVATRLSGVPELVVDGATGLLVPPGNVEALAATLATLIADPARRAALGAAGGARVRRDFDMARGIDRLAERFGLGRAGIVSEEDRNCA